MHTISSELETFLGDLSCNVVSLFPEPLSKPKSDHGIILSGNNKPTGLKRVFDKIEHDCHLSNIYRVRSFWQIIQFFAFYESITK